MKINDLISGFVTQNFLAGLLLGLGVAYGSLADAAVWDDTTIGDIIDDVDAVKGQIIGNGPIPTVAREFRDQLDDLADAGPALKDTVQQLLQAIKNRQGPFTDFTGDPKCDFGTECAIFREQLTTFVSDIAALRENFPAIDQLGIGDGSRFINLIEQVPPVFLFLPYEVLSLTPQWRNIPALLQELVDMIDDPEAFSLDLPDPLAPSQSGLRTAQFSPASTTGSPTETFCQNHVSRLDPATDIDPVRLHRIQLLLSFAYSIMDMLVDIGPDRWNLAIAGEGTDIPVPVKILSAVMRAVIEVGQAAADTFRANLQVCRDRQEFLEVSIAQCSKQVEFILPGTRDEIYSFVVAVVDNADSLGLDVGNSRKSLEKVDRHRGNGKYRNAYNNLCKAYSKIGL